MACLFALTVPAAAGAADSVLQRYSFAKESLEQWKLPKKLREVSGLAEHQGRVYTHDDQSGIVYEIDYEAARLRKAFALGRPTLSGDFEGIAIAGERFFLMTSDGTLYEFSEGDNGERVGFRRYRTGLGRQCELEGLAYQASLGSLLLVCKQARVEALRAYVAIFAWSLDERRLQSAPYLLVPLEDVTDSIPGRKFNPSGIAFDAATGNLLIVAARQRALAEIDPDGRVVTAMQIPLSSRHRQAEGIALLPDGRLLLADEGSNKKARLALYSPARAAP